MRLGLSEGILCKGDGNGGDSIGICGYAVNFDVDVDVYVNGDGDGDEGGDGDDYLL